MPEFECGYCGEVALATDDHVPAKNLFVGQLDSALPSVKSCGTCNNGASRDDEYFRDTVLMYHRTADAPRAQVHIEKILRAVGMPAKRGYAKATINRIRAVEVQSPSGIYLGRQPALVTDQVRMQRVAARYARGLHRYHYGERVPADTPMRVLVDPDALHVVAEKFVAGFKGAEVATIQTGVFWYARLRPPDAPSRSYWFMMFFDAFPIVVAMRPDKPFPRCASI